MTLASDFLAEPDFALTWHLRYGGEVVGMHDVPIPSLYGPTADEQG